MKPLKALYLIMTVILGLTQMVPNTHAGTQGQLLREEFEETTVQDREPPPGRTGQGWTQSGTDEELVQPLTLDGAVRGSISFDLQRISDNDKSTSETVFEFLDKDGKRVWRLQIQWESTHGPTALLLKSAPAREYIQYGVHLWNPVIYLDRVVEPGEWVHLELFWDDGEGLYGALEMVSHSRPNRSPWGSKRTGPLSLI